jgi:hypothetical protein
MSYLLVALGLSAALVGVALFLFPKPPPLDFTAFLGGHQRLFLSLALIVAGGAAALYGILAL